MNKQLQKILAFTAVAVVGYLLLRPKQVKTSSSAADKMKLTCAQGEKLVEEPTGMRCVPTSEVVSGPTPSVSLSADGTVIKFSSPNISGVPTNIVSNFASMAGVNIKANDFFTQKPGGFYR